MLGVQYTDIKRSTRRGDKVLYKHVPFKVITKFFRVFLSSSVAFIITVTNLFLILTLA